MRRFISYGPALVVLLTSLVVLMGAPAAVYRIRAADTRAQIVLAQQQLDDSNILEQINRATQQVATAVKPSVVSLEVITPGRRMGVRSTGSGWIYDSLGHIVTNAHVVRGAEAIAVEFPDGRVVEAQEVGGDLYRADPFTDIAVIKVPTDAPLFPARRASDARPQVGDRVFAFGSPFGFKFSMTEGIISGLGRDPGAAVLAGGFTNFIQTDAAVNPGNSGGPLVDIQGRVLGMNVAIATGKESNGTTEGQSAGISFAIPLLTIESIVSQLIEKGEVRRGFLGIQWPRLENPVVFVPEIGKRGVQVVGLAEDGPAKSAGVKPGDIITSIAGQQVLSMEALRALVTSLPPGQAVQVLGYRGGKEVSFEVTLGEYPRETLSLEAAVPSLVTYGLKPQFGGELPSIEVVFPNSAADDAGFRAGDVILRVADKPVQNWQDVALAAAEAGLLVGRRVPFTVVASEEDQSPQPRTIDVQVVR
jgi:serine protease Do